MAVFFSLGKNDSGLPKSNKQPKKNIERNNKIMKNQSAFSVFNHFGLQFLGLYPKNAKNPYLSRTKPY